MTTRYDPTRAIPRTLTDPYPARPARPLVLADAARELLTLADLAPVPSFGPQAQGDTAFLPWPAFLAPAARALAAATARPVGRAGTVLVPTGDGGGSHLLLTEAGPGVLLAPSPTPGTLATVVVRPGAVARLAHDEHADLRIGPGVYAVRRQRRYTPARNEWVED
jgi:hypothetical protein